jgi:hypothetical protein
MKEVKLIEVEVVYTVQADCVKQVGLLFDQDLT